jgi:flagellar biogenesis protein FliO
MVRSSTLGMVGAALLCAVPSLASANRLKLKSYQLEPTRFVIELEGTDALGEPWMRVSGSTARIWFPEIETLSRFEQGEAEAPIKSLMLRPGTPKTALLLLELRPDRVLTPRDVEVSRDGTHATIRIALPAAAAQAPAASAATPAAVATGAATTPGAAPASAEVVAPTAPAVAVVAAPAVVDPAAKPAAVASAPVSPEPGFKQAEAGTAEPRAELPRALQRKAEPKLLEPKDQFSTVQLLLLLTVVLGAVYGLLRIALRKRGAEFAPTEIQLLGSKRLGARHQLLIVRALGQDHLISVNGGRTERIASTDTRPAHAGANVGTSVGANANAASALPATQPKSPPRLGLGLSSALRAMRGHELFAGAEEQRVAAAARGPIGETPFGAELLDFVRTGETRNAGLSETRNAGLSESEAIAGLVRLRKRSS